MDEGGRIKPLVDINDAWREIERLEQRMEFLERERVRLREHWLCREWFMHGLMVGLVVMFLLITVLAVLEGGDADQPDDPPALLVPAPEEPGDVGPPIP